MNESDLDLLNKIRAGDHGAFAVLYTRFRRLVSAAVRRAGVPDSEVEDVAQDVFIDLYQKFGKGEVEATNLKAFIWTRATWKAWDHHKRVKRSPSDLAQGETEEDEMRVNAHETLRLRVEVREILMRLSENDRHLLIRKDVEGLSYEDIAADLGISVSAVKMRVLRARLAFKRLQSKVML